MPSAKTFAYKRLMKSVLSATALSAIGLSLAGTSALADNWVDHTAPGISVDTSIPNTTNITQTLGRVTVRGDADINAGWTVNLAQPSSTSQYILYDVEGDPTYLLGTLNANGQVFIFNQNGIIFGQNSRVDVGGILASTGTLDLGTSDLDNGKIDITHVAPGSTIELNGTVSVADAGLAGFVAPTVINNGTINAKMGKVVLASGERVTLDLYGDDLVEIALSDAVSDGLIKNQGTINVEGGTAVLKAQVAKNIVDNVINMDGVINASSATVSGGKIILGGGASGTVKVSGKMAAKTIDVRGENVAVTSSAEINAAQKGASVNLIAQKQTDFAGFMQTGQNSSVEISAPVLNLNGTLTTGENSHVILDPVSFIVDAVQAAFIAGLMNVSGVTVDVTASDLIEVNSAIDTSAQATNSILRFKDEDSNGTLQIDLNALITLASTQRLIGEGSLVNVASTGRIQNGVDVAASGATVNVAAGTFMDSVRINKALTLLGANAGITGDGVRGAATIIDSPSTAFTITADNVTVDGFNVRTAAQDAFFIRNADNVTIQNNLIREVGRSAVYATGSNDLSILRNLTINPQTKFYGVFNVSKGNNVTIDDNTLDGGYYGVKLTDISGDTIVTNNNIGGMKVDGVYATGIENGLFEDNTIVNSGNGIRIVNNNTGSVSIHHNVFDRNKIGVYLDNVSSVLIDDNWVNRSTLDAIRIKDSSDIDITGNLIKWTGDKGIRITGSDLISIYNHNIFDTIYGNAIYGKNSDDIYIDGNDFSDVYSKRFGVIHADRGSNWTILNNLIQGGTYGVNLTEVGGYSEIGGNTMQNNAIDGIHLSNTDTVDIHDNAISDSKGQGIHIDGSNVGTVYLSGNILNNNIFGISIESGTIDLTGSSNEINGGLVGIQFVRNAGTAPLSLVSSAFDVPGTSGTIGTTRFSGQVRNYVEFVNNAFSLGVDSPLLIDGTYASYDGFSPNSFARDINGYPILTQPQIDSVEDHVLDYLDLNSLGDLVVGALPTATTLAANIDEKDTLRFFQSQNIQVSGLNITFRGLPRVGGANPAAQPNGINLNSISTFAGGSSDPGSPNALNNITTAAGGPVSPEAIEPAAGGEQSATCWNDALNAAQNGAPVNYSYTGTIEDTLNGASACKS